MNEKCMRGILEGMQADVARIDAKGEAFQRECEKDKERRIEMGNEALRSAVTGYLLPKHEQFELAVEKIDMEILNVISALSALDYEKDKTIRQMDQEREKLGVDLSFLRFARGIAESANRERSDLIKDLTQGIGGDDLAWYNDPESGRSTYYSVLTIDESLREEEEGGFPDRYGCSTIVPILYLGKDFKELKSERPGKWKEDEDRSKTKERIACKLAEFTEKGLIPPVSIRLYPDSPFDIDFTYCFGWPFGKLRPNRCFIIAVEAECF